MQSSLSKINSHRNRAEFQLLTRSSSTIIHFYRATRMHIADYAVARCPSVRPSVHHTPVFCLNGYTYQRHFFTTG